MWWVQPFRKYWLLSFKTAKMTFTSHFNVFFYSNTSFFLLPCVVEGGVVPDPKDPPWICPCSISLQRIMTCGMMTVTSLV